MRLRNYEQGENMDSFERLKRRAKKHDVKVAKGTEQLVESLADQNKRLSNQVLVLTKLYRACYRLLPKNAQEEIDKIRKDIDTLAALEDVHP